jgi:hypothetical protein
VLSTCYDQNISSQHVNNTNQQPNPNPTTSTCQKFTNNSNYKNGVSEKSGSRRLVALAAALDAGSIIDFVKKIISNFSLLF